MLSGKRDEQADLFPARKVNLLAYNATNCLLEAVNPLQPAGEDITNCCPILLEFRNHFKYYMMMPCTKRAWEIKACENMEGEVVRNVGSQIFHSTPGPVGAGTRLQYHVANLIACTELSNRNTRTHIHPHYCLPLRLLPVYSEKRLGATGAP